MTHQYNIKLMAIDIIYKGFIKISDDNCSSSKNFRYDLNYRVTNRRVLLLGTRAIC